MRAGLAIFGGAMLLMASCGVRGLEPADLGRETPTTAEPTAELPNTQSTPPVRLLGYVFDHDSGSKLPGAKVSAANAPAAESAVEGRFRLEVSRPGLTQVVVTAPGYWEEVFFIELAEGDNEVGLAVQRNCSELACPESQYCGVTHSCYAGEGPATLSGRITDACDGAPRSVLVRFGKHSTCTDEAGNYAVTGLVGGDSQNLVIEEQGYEKVEYPTWVRAGENEGSFSLHRTAGCQASKPADLPCTLQ